MVYFQTQLGSDAIFVRRVSPKLLGSLLSCSDLASSCSPFATARSRSMAGQLLPRMEVLSKSTQSHKSFKLASQYCGELVRLFSPPLVMSSWMLREPSTRFVFTARRATASTVAGCASPCHLCAMRSVAGVMLLPATERP